MIFSQVAILASRLEPAEWATAIVVCTIGATLLFVLVRYFYDALGLRKFPAPSWIAASTDLWCAINSHRGRRYLAIEAAHQKHGPVVRIAYSHLSFNSADAVRDIYSHLNGSKCMKSEFYDNLAGEFHNIANVRDREEHQVKRRYYSHAFAHKSIVELEPIVSRYVVSLIDKLEALPNTRTNPIGIDKWLNYFTFDVIGEISVGQTFGFLESGSDATLGQYKHSTNDEWHTVSSTIKSLHEAFSFKVAIGQMSHKWYLLFFKLLVWYKGRRAVDLFTSVAIGQVRRRMRPSYELERKQEHADFFDKVLLDRTGKERKLPFMELVSEAIVLLNAGSDTTSSGMTSLVYEVARNPAVQAKLRAELDAAVGCLPAGTPVTYDQVKGLPYLKACLDENLRLNPPIPYGPPRLVIDPNGMDISGHHIAHGTTVSVPTYTIHRNDEIFPDPHVFRPERWLEPMTEDKKEVMQRAFVPFSTGPRSCLGRNLAMMEQQVVLGTLFYHYSVSLADPSFVPTRFEAFNLDPGPLPVVLEKRVGTIA